MTAASRFAASDAADDAGRQLARLARELDVAILALAQPHPDVPLPDGEPPGPAWLEQAVPMARHAELSLLLVVRRTRPAARRERAASCATCTSASCAPAVPIG